MRKIEQNNEIRYSVRDGRDISHLIGHMIGSVFFFAHKICSSNALNKRKKLLKFCFWWKKKKKQKKTKFIIPVFFSLCEKWAIVKPTADGRVFFSVSSFVIFIEITNISQMITRRNEKENKYKSTSYAWIFCILVLCISIFLRITSCSHSMKTGFVGAEHNNWTKSNAQKREMFTFFLYFARKKAKRLIRDTRISWTQGNVSSAMKSNINNDVCKMKYQQC